MFTGIVSHLGLFKGYRQSRQIMAIEVPGLGSELKTGDSLAVNGVCLSLLKTDREFLLFNLSRETISRSNLDSLRPGARLNLELPLTLSTPLSGHLVTGHVDGLGKVLRFELRRPGKRLFLSYPPDLRPFFVPKGSLALNGVSLTVASLGPSVMEIELIPLTLEGTNLGSLKPGDPVNIECDIIGKYVYNWMFQGKRRS
jgi:riboflavin synthase